MIAISGTVLEERLLRSGGGCGGGVGGEGGLAQAEAKAKAGCSETPMFLSHGLRGLCIFFFPCMCIACVSYVYNDCISYVYRTWYVYARSYAQCMPIEIIHQVLHLDMIHTAHSDTPLYTCRALYV